MSRFLVTFQSNDPNESSAIISSIKQLGAWAKINKCTYCIKCDINRTVDVRESIIGNKNLTDKFILFVTNITNSGWASYKLPKEVAAWLKNKD